MQKIDHLKALNSILTSTTFTKSETHKKLLQYLGSCYEKHIVPTEYDIAVHVYGRDQNFSPVEDTIVRVGVYKLRKKLENYYKSEGSRDAIVLSIPKGHYTLEFSANTSTFFHRGIDRRTIVVLLVIVLSLSFLTILWQHRKIKRLEHHLGNFHFLDQDAPIWNSFFDNNFSFLLTVGDYYIFEHYEESLGYHRRIMDYYINSDLEFDRYLSEHPSNTFKKLPIGEIPHHSIFNLKDLSLIFHSFQTDYSIVMSSAFDLNDTRNHNILYIGDFKSLRLLEGFVTSHNISFHNTDGFSGILKIVNPAQDTSLVFDCSQIDLSKESASVDYCLLLKNTGPEGENYFFITGFGYTSQLETIHMLSEKKRLKEFSQKLPKVDGKIVENFIAVMKVSGYYMTPHELEVVYVKGI